MTDPIEVILIHMNKINNALILLEEIHSKCAIKGDVNINEILYLIEKVAGILDDGRHNDQ